MRCKIVYSEVLCPSKCTLTFRARYEGIKVRYENCYPLRLILVHVILSQVALRKIVLTTLVYFIYSIEHYMLTPTTAGVSCTLPKM